MLADANFWQYIKNVTCAEPVPIFTLVINEIKDFASAIRAVKSNFMSKTGVRYNSVFFPDSVGGALMRRPKHKNETDSYVLLFLEANDCVGSVVKNVKAISVELTTKEKQKY